MGTGGGTGVRSSGLVESLVVRLPSSKQSKRLRGGSQSKKKRVEYTSFTLLVETVGAAGACLAGEPFSGSTLMRTASGDAARDA